MKRSIFTNPVISFLQPNEIFVFGSNLAGVHGAGAARVAMVNFGAKYGTGVGLTGQCYALPTKDDRIISLPLEQIEYHIQALLATIIKNPIKKFLITEVGCGLAGFTPEQIAPMFDLIYQLPNAVLPESFCKIIERNRENGI